MAIGIFFAALVLVGYGTTYLTGQAMVVEERLAFGTVIGTMLVVFLGYLTALLWGFGLSSVLIGLGAAAAISAMGWWVGRRSVTAEILDLRDRWRSRLATPEHPWPILLVVAVCWPYALRLLSQAYIVSPQGLFAGHLDSWSDWSAHLAYAGSFAYGNNLPPQLPIDPGHSLDYHYLMDFFAASLVPLGANLTSSLVLTSGLLAFAFPVVMYLAVKRIIGSRAVAIVSVFVFLLAGGLGFVYIVGDIDRLGFQALVHLPHEYATNRDLNYWFINPVLSYLYPQRPTLFGFSIALIGLSLLWTARRARTWLPFLFVGILAGISPLFHVQGYGTLVLVAAFWAVMAPHRRWLAFFLPALVLGLPALISILPPTNPLRVQYWWVANTAGHNDGFLWFWLKNAGLFIPLLLVAQFWPSLTPKRFALYFSPFWLWFLVPNVLVFHPWDWDNVHYFAFWTLFGSVMVAAVVVRLFQRSNEGRVLAVICFVGLTLAGTLDLARAADYQMSAIQLTDNDGIAVADWARTHTKSSDIFLVAPVHVEPVMSLGARKVVMGFQGWVWDLGMPDWQERLADAGRMLRGEPGTEQLLRKYGVVYVVIGPHEKEQPYGANQAYWDRRGRRVYSQGSYTVYLVR